MGKSKINKEETIENPFAGFNLVKGDFIPPVVDTEDNIEDEDTSLIKDEVVEDEATRLAKGDKALEAVIKKTTGKTLTKEEQEVEDLLNEDEGIENDPKETSLFKEFTKELSTKGIIDFDDTDSDFEDSEEGIAKLVGKTVETRLEDKINTWYNQLPKDFQELLDFTQNGGTPKQFMDVYYGNHSWENFSIDSEESQKAVVRESLRLAGDTEEDINDMITEWTDNGTLEKRAKSALPKVQKNELIQKTQIVEAQKQYAERVKEEQKATWENFKKDLFSREEVKGFKLTPKLKEKVWDHLTTIDRKTGKTGYQLAVENDNEATILFALQSAMKFNVEELEKQVNTKVSSKMGNLLKNYSKNTKDKISSGSTEAIKDNDPFKGFKTIK